MMGWGWGEKGSQQPGGAGTGEAGVMPDPDSER